MKAAGQTPLRGAMPQTISTAVRRQSGRNSTTGSPTTLSAPDSPGNNSPIRALRSFAGSPGQSQHASPLTRFTPVRIPGQMRAYSTDGTEDEYRQIRSNFFVEQRSCSSEEIERLQSKFGAALEGIAFQPPGICHTQVSEIAWHLANPATSRPPAAVQQEVGAAQGMFSNLIARAKSFWRGGVPADLEDICRNGFQERYKTVVIHASMGAADTKSQMVHSALQHLRNPDAGGVSGGANHSIAILDVDTERGVAYVFDPDYTRETDEATAMRAYCEQKGVQPHQLSYQEIEEHGWLGELLRAVSTDDLAAKCVPQLGGVIGIPKQPEQ